jgi:hypothetical protein
MAAKSRGIISAMLFSKSHQSIQNKVHSPLPISEVIAIEKKAWT